MTRANPAFYALTSGLLIMALVSCSPRVQAGRYPETDSVDKVASLSREAAPFLDIEFVIDKGFDRTRIYGILRADDPAGMASRAASMGIPLDVAERIHRAKSYDEVAQVLSQLVDERYDQLSSSLDRARQEYSALWQPIVRTFSSTVTTLTEHEWVHGGYVCVVSAFHPGLSDWHGNMIAARYDLAPKMKRRIVAHEIVLSHVFQLFRVRHDRSKLDDWRVWAFSEISAVFILSDASLHPLWPDLAGSGEYFARSNYPQLAPLEDALLAVWSDRRDFVDYLDRSIPILLEFQQTHRSEIR